MKTSSCKEHEEMHAARHMSNILTSSVTAVIEAAAFATYHPHALKP